MEFRILGPLEVSDATGAGVALRGSRERMLLALLLLSANRVVPADRLIDGLWGDEPPDGATHALQVHVSRLRKALRDAAGAEVVVTRAPGYLLQVDPAAVDCVRFDALVARGREEAAQRDHGRAAATLRQALALWRGPALADVAEAPGIRAEAVRLDEARLTALEERVEADLACRRHGPLTAELDALTREHPYRERIWAQRMTALYRSGRQAEALRAYQVLRAALGDGLGLEPSAELQRLEGAILRGDPALDAPADPAPEWGAQPGPAGAAPGAAGGAAAAGGLPRAAGGRAGRTPFVGRATERAVLSAALGRAAGGCGHVVLIGGEPGIGKTRLAEEAAAEADRRGLRVLTGHCYEQEGTPPYVAVVEILELALAQADNPEVFLAGTLGEAAPEVARLLPRLRRLFPALPAPLTLPPQQERRYLFTCLGDVLSRLAAARPTVVILDDLQWADDPTLLFLEHLAPRLASLPLVVIATYRHAEVGPGLGRTLEALHRRHLGERLVLRGMGPGEAAELVRALTGQDAPAGVVDGLHAETDGNPFFLEEVVRDLVEDGRAIGGDGRFRPDVDVATLAVPEGVRLVIGRRLERLSDDAGRLLLAAAVAGPAVRFSLLRRLTDLDDDTVLDAVEEATRAMLLREQPAEPRTATASPGETEFLFAHELIRQTLVSYHSGPRRARTHLRVAQAMMDAGPGQAEEDAAEIAHHLAAAGDEADPQAILTWSLRAGRRALAASAHEQALSHLERAARLETLAGPAQRADLFGALASAYDRLGRPDDALAAWERALAEHESSADGEAIGRTCLEVSAHLLWANRLRESVAMCHRGLAALGERVNADRARLLASLAASAVVGGDAAAGDDMFDEALRISGRLGDDALRGFVLGQMVGGRYNTMRTAEAVAAGTEGAALMRSSGDLWGAATTLGITAMCLVHSGRFPEATAACDELRPLGERVGNFPALFLVMRARGIQSFWQTGDVAALEAFGREDVDFCERHLPAFAGHAYSRVGVATFLRGDWEAAEAWLRRGLERPPAIVPGYCRSPWFQYLVYAGRRDDALAFFAEWRAELPDGPGPELWTAWVMLMAFTEGLYLLGERDGPAAWYPLVLAACATGVVATDNYGGRLVERIAGIAATAAGERDAAEEHFRAALRQADELPHQLERLETRRFYARMLTERGGPGDRERARTLLTEAFEGFSRLGMARHAELTRAELVSG